MNIKEQAYRAHASLQASGVTSLTRSQTHELLAAAVGYGTYAAFQHDATWCEVPFGVAGIETDLVLLKARCTQLGLQPDEVLKVADALPRFQHETGYTPVRFEWLIDAFDNYEDDASGPQWLWTHIVEPARGIGFFFQHHRVLLEGLEEAAQRGVPSAHLAIAKVLESEVMLFGDEEERMKRQARREGWMCPFVSFAEVEASPLRSYEKHRHHLLAAARGGDLRALMESAERYGYPAILDQAPSEDMDPMAMVDLAAEHGDAEKIRYWLTIAAQQGNTGAMRELIRGFGEPLDQAWVWMYLSRLLGDDLSRDRFEAINEDGSPYDDDVGGPAYVGGYEGIELDPLPTVADTVARQAAAELFAHIDTQLDDF